MESHIPARNLVDGVADERDEPAALAAHTVEPDEWDLVVLPIPEQALAVLGDFSNEPQGQTELTHIGLTGLIYKHIGINLGDMLCNHDPRVLKKLYQLCPGPFNVILQSDASLLSQLLLIDEFVFFRDTHGEARLTVNDCTESTPIVPSNAPSSTFTVGQSVAAAATARHVKQEISLYFSSTPCASSSTVTPRLHSILGCALTRFAASLEFMRTDGVLLDAWCALLCCIVEERLFTQTKWVGESKFEACLAACSATLERFRETCISRHISQTHIQCPFDPCEVEEAVKKLEPYSPGLRPQLTLLTASAILAYVPHNFYLMYHAFHSGYIAKQTIVADLVAQVASFAAFSLGSATFASPIAGRLAGATVAEFVRSTLQEQILHVRPQKAPSLLFAYAILGLNPAGAHEYCTERVQMQLEFALQRDGDPLLLWTAYEYIRKHHRPDLWNPFKKHDAALLALDLDPKSQHSPKNIRKKYLELAQRSSVSDAVDLSAPSSAYCELASGWVGEHYVFHKVRLGQGGCGTVWHGLDRKEKQLVTMKEICKASASRRHLFQELKMLSDCKGDTNIIGLLNYFENKSSFFLVFEYCDGGNFGDKVKNLGVDLQEHTVVHWMFDVCSAIASLHSNRIIHRDIKPDNFLVSHQRLKLADFGLSIYNVEGRFRTERCGTPGFMAPEVLLLPNHSHGYSQPVDMWASGVTLYMMMQSGRLPFQGFRGEMKMGVILESRLTNRNFDVVLSPLPNFSEDAWSICRQMLNPDVNSRISAHQALLSPWLSHEPQGVQKRRVEDDVPTCFIAKESMETTFTMQVSKRGRKLGISFSDTSCEIFKIWPGGVVAEWCDANPEKFRGRCFILEINGMQGSLHLLDTNEDLSILIGTMKGAWKCPNGHRLEASMTTKMRGRCCKCYLCHKQVSEGALHHVCCLCKWDMCHACSQDVG